MENTLKKKKPNYKKIIVVGAVVGGIIFLANTIYGAARDVLTNLNFYVTFLCPSPLKSWTNL